MARTARPPGRTGGSTPSSPSWSLSRGLSGCESRHNAIRGRRRWPALLRHALRRACRDRADASLYALKLEDGDAESSVTAAERQPSPARRDQVLPPESPGFLGEYAHGLLPIAACGGIRSVGRRGSSHCQNRRSETSGRCPVARPAIMTRSVATLKIRSTRSGSDQRWFSTKAIQRSGGMMGISEYSSSCQVSASSKSSRSASWSLSIVVNLAWCFSVAGSNAHLSRHSECRTGVSRSA
jgi:hypothetical protein